MSSRDDTVEVDPPSERNLSDRVRVNIWLKKELYEQIQEIAIEDDVKVAPLIRQGLKHYVKARREGRT